MTKETGIYSFEIEDEETNEATLVYQSQSKRVTISIMPDETVIICSSQEGRSGVRLDLEKFLDLVWQSSGEKT